MTDKPKRGARAGLSKNITTSKEPPVVDSHSISETSSMFSTRGGQMGNGFDHRNSSQLPPHVQSVSASHRGKRLLPPLPRAYGVSSSSVKGSDKNRTSHACNHCRKSKAKCSGGLRCDKCRNEQRECVYGDGKRDQERKDMERLSKHNMKLNALTEKLTDLLESLLKNDQLDLESQNDIQVLVEESQQIRLNDDREIHATHDRVASRPKYVAGEESVDADVGSTGSLDMNDEDTNRNAEARNAGFLGKSSAVTWIQKARKAHDDDLSTSPGALPSQATFDNTFDQSFYHAEDSELSNIETDAVNALERPTDETAVFLVELYFSTVHPSFPILPRAKFMQTFNKFLFHRQSDRLSYEDQGWISMLNIVFAIAAKYSHLIQSERRGDTQDHLVYYTRAQKLGFEHRALHKAPELQHTTCLGLCALYLLISDQLNGSWRISGMAIRSATTLGLHVRNKAPELSDTEKQFRVRLWWCLYSLEGLLVHLTGRPNSISGSDISTTLPLNLEEDEQDAASPLHQVQDPETTVGKQKDLTQAFTSNTTAPSSTNGSGSAANSPMSVPPIFSISAPLVDSAITSSTYFILRTQLSIISHEISSQLYCAGLVQAKWSQVQDKIRYLDAKLLEWKNALPRVYDFRYCRSGDQWETRKIGLAMFWHSSRMILYRCYLCRFDRQIPNESARSKSFGSKSPVICVESARDVISLLPPPARTTFVHELQPFWTTLHYIIEATSVLLLEMAYNAEHVPSIAQDILEDAKKATRWLYILAEHSSSAKKSWEMFNKLLKQVAPMIGGDATDLPAPSCESPEDFEPGRGIASNLRRGSQRTEDSADLSHFVEMSTTTADWVDQVSTHSHTLHQDTTATMPNYHALSGNLGSQFFTPQTPFPQHHYGQFDQFGPFTSNGYDSFMATGSGSDSGIANFHMDISGPTDSHQVVAQTDPFAEARNGQGDAMLHGQYTQNMFRQGPFNTVPSTYSDNSWWYNSQG